MAEEKKKDGGGQREEGRNIEGAPLAIKPPS